MTACVSIVIYSNITNCTVCSTMYDNNGDCYEFLKNCFYGCGGDDDDQFYFICRFGYISLEASCVLVYHFTFCFI